MIVERNIRKLVVLLLRVFVLSCIHPVAIMKIPRNLSTRTEIHEGARARSEALRLLHHPLVRIRWCLWQPRAACKRESSNSEGKLSLFNMPWRVIEATVSLAI